MPSLVTLKGRVGTLRNMKSVELVQIPVLETCVIPSAFKCVEDVKMENAGKLETVKEVKEVKELIKRKKEEAERRREEKERKRREEAERKKREEEERLRREREKAEEAAKKRAVISCKRNWDRIDTRVGVIEMSDGCCNEEGLKELDLSGFEYLRELKVGSGCFMYVDEVKWVGLNYLETVEIGNNSFTKYKNTYDITTDPNRHFYLKNCPKLKSLKMGRYSFSDYTVIEIENVDALEVIEMGDLEYMTGCFCRASILELKSIVIHRE